MADSLCGDNMSEEDKAIEREYFTWEGWDEMDTSCLYFYNCELIRDIADIPKGTKVPGIHCDHQKSLMQIHLDEDCKDYRVFKISYQIGEEITDRVKEEARLADLKWKAERAEIDARLARSAFEREQRKQEEGIQ